MAQAISLYLPISPHIFLTPRRPCGAGKNRNISYQPIGQMFSYPFSRSGNEIWGDLGRSGEMFSYPFSQLGNEIWGDLGRSGGEVFSYPFSQLGNETEDGTHYPRLADLQYLCELAGVRLKVVALWREPVDAIMSMNNRGLPKIWRRAGRTFKLHKQAGVSLSLRRGEIVRDRPRSSEITQDSAEISRDCARLRGIARDCARLRGIARDCAGLPPA